MSRPDEQHLEEEEVVEATSEDSEEGQEVEGHIWLRDADRAADISRSTKTA
jgi:hypothetical protein